MPYEGNTNEMPVMKSFTDSNKIYMVWAIPAEAERFKKKSLELIETLVNHKGEGSLYQCLKGLNYI